MDRRIQSRRAVLRKSAGAITGIGIGAIGGIVDTAAAALPHHVTLSGNGDLYYELHVNGNIEPGNDVENPDTDHGSYCTGTIVNALDNWDYSGDITEIIMEGTGQCSFYITAGHDPSYNVDIYTEGSDTVHYLWDQEGYMEGRNGTLESSDTITRQDDGTYSVDGYIGAASDEYSVGGYPSYLVVDDGPRETFHWRAYGY